jgi:hypothetical protein
VERKKLSENSKTFFAAQTSIFLVNGLVNITQRKFDPIGTSSGQGKPVSSGTSSIRLENSLLG